MARLILDSGAVIAFARGDARVAAPMRIAADRGDEVVVPAVVVAQTIRGGARDAPVNRLLKAVNVSPVDLHLARSAGELLGKTGLRDALDALVMAEATRGGPAVVLTSDPDDMHALAQYTEFVRVVRV